MTTYKVAELTGELLDAAVAKALLPTAMRLFPRSQWREGYEPPTKLAYSTDWAAGGQIIERERLVLGPTETAGEWIAFADGATIFDSGSDTLTGSNVYGVGPTPLIAAMRAFVASELGDTVEIDK